MFLRKNKVRMKLYIICFVSFFVLFFCFGLCKTWLVMYIREKKR